MQKCNECECFDNLYRKTLDKKGNILYVKQKIRLLYKQRNEQNNNKKYTLLQ